MTPPPAKPEARRCPRCQLMVQPRGGRTPRFCSVCGQSLGPLPQREMSGTGLPRPVPPAATASALLGLCSLVPVIGLLLGLVAILLGGMAKQTIDNSDGRLGGEGIAGFGIFMGVIGIILSIVVCGRFY